MTIHKSSKGIKANCYEDGGVVDEEPGAMRREQMQVDGAASRQHLGRGVTGKFAMGGRVSHKTEGRCE